MDDNNAEAGARLDPASGGEAPRAPEVPEQEPLPPVPGSPLALWHSANATVAVVVLVAVVGGACVALAVGGAAWLDGLFRAVEDPWDSSQTKGALFVIAVAVLMLALNHAVGRRLTRRLAPERDVHQDWLVGDDVLVRLARRIRHAMSGRRVRAAGGLVAVVVLVWAFPVVHGVVILLWAYPLVTWIPVLAGLAVVGVGVAIDRQSGVSGAARLALTWRTTALLVFWAVAMIALPSLQGRATYEATRYSEITSLPARTQPRLLPKEAAQSYGSEVGLRDEHLVLDPATRQLEYSAERKPGFARGASSAIGLQQLDRIDGSSTTVRGGFRTAVSQVGPGSLSWYAYRHHPLTRLLERVIVPLGHGRAVALAPYIGYAGFLVRHPVWRGVYVLHQDGRIEDLTPRAAMARPELAQSGHLFPEKLARLIAQAYGDRRGAMPMLHHDRTVVSDPRPDENQVIGNPQPYLTNLGAGRVRWVTVAHPPGRDEQITAVFLTDSVTGRTQVWRAPAGRPVLSNRGALDLVARLPLKWHKCCDENDDAFDIRRATEPRPVFLRGRLYYLVSIVPENGLKTRQPVDRTVLVDAARRRIVRVFNHANSEADDALRAFFGISLGRG